MELSISLSKIAKVNMIHLFGWWFSAFLLQASYLGQMSQAKAEAGPTGLDSQVPAAPKDPNSKGMNELSYIDKHDQLNICSLISL